MLRLFRVVAVSGPGTGDYPILRVADFKVLGKPYSPGIKYVSLMLVAGTPQNFALCTLRDAAVVVRYRTLRETRGRTAGDASVFGLCIVRVNRIDTLQPGT